MIYIQEIYGDPAAIQADDAAVSLKAEIKDEKADGDGEQRRTCLPDQDS